MDFIITHGMKVVKKGFIFSADERIEWAVNTFMCPTPILINEENIRVYGSCRDEKGQARIGFVDVAANNPQNILKVSKKPVLDIGEDGMFDDNGVILGDVIKVGDLYYMYYVGFQIPRKAKFMANTGLAISKDGENFERYKKTPIADRTDNAPFGRCIHTVLQDEGIFKIWYAVIYGWEFIDGRPYPRYNIRYMESPDGIHMPDEEGISCITCRGNEYRIGRPRVIKRKDNLYEMRYTYDTRDKEYIAGFATSPDGVNWHRDDEKSGLVKSLEGWDSEMACYPVELKTKYGTYLFYDGNGMGTDGFGYAILED